MAIETVTGGMLFFLGTRARGLTLQTRKLIASINTADTGSFSIPMVAETGKTIDVSGNLSGDQTLKSGTGYYDGTTYTELWYAGTLKFNAEPITVPGGPPGPAVKRSRFEFDGTLRAHRQRITATGGGPAVFDVELSGAGKATIYFSAAQAQGSQMLRSVIAQFYGFAIR